MTTDSAGYAAHHEDEEPLSVEDVARSQGVEPKTVSDLACDEIFDTDEELDEFLVFVREQRNASLA